MIFYDCPGLLIILEDFILEDFSASLSALMKEIQKMSIEEYATYIEEIIDKAIDIIA